MADTSPLPDEVAFGLMVADARETALHSALATLDDTERLIVHERWLTDEIAPLAALGDFLGVTPQTVKRIEVAAIAKIQAAVFNGTAGGAIAA